MSGALHFHEPPDPGTNFRPAVLGDLLDRTRKGFGDRADLHYRRYRGDPSAWLAPYGGSGSEGAV